MRMGRGGRERLLVASLLVVAAASLGVVAEAEANYRSLATAEGTEAATVAAEPTDTGVTLTLAVTNTMNRPLRVDYVRLRLRGPDGTTTVSVPFRGRVTAPPGTSRLTAAVLDRRLPGDPVAGDRLVVAGHAAVVVFNGYEFEVPVREREVAL